MQFSSSVADVKEESGTVRKRQNIGSLDIRFAPVLNILPDPTWNDRLYTFWTPFAVDAAVSSETITENNVSMNRIVLSSDLEFRIIPERAGTYSDSHRIVVGSRNVSDRDFKQAEFDGYIEYRPVFGSINKALAAEVPLRKDWLIEPDRKMVDMNQIPGRWFGYEFLPVIGGEFGRAYRNRRREATVLNDETVKRFYFGGVIAFDLTKYVRLLGEDTIYLRGESDDDRFHNYFKASFEVALPAFSDESAHSVFFGYEKGNKPPFATPDVNALKLGYRVQWDGWFQRWR